MAIRPFLAFTELFTARGRVNRLQFAVYGVGSLVALVGLEFAVDKLLELLQPPLIMDIGHATMLRRFIILAAVLLAIFLVYALFCVTARRLHDLGLPAVCVLIMFIGSLSDAVVSFADPYFPLDGPVADLVTNAGYVLAPVFVLLLCIWPGKRGDNRYGPDLQNSVAIADTTEA